MKRRYKIVLGLAVLAIAGAAAGYWYFNTADSREPSRVAWNAHCAGCHGKALEGTERASGLVDVQLKHGDTVEEMTDVIAKGVPGTTMEAWGEKLTP